jgi:hypothetical protein
MGSGMGYRRQPILKRQSGFVGHITRDMQPLLARLGQSVERRLNIGHAVRGDDLHRIAIEPRRRAARPGIVEQAKFFMKTGQAHGAS